jgi:hypothetical protein
MDLDLLHSSISTKFSSFSRPSCAAAVHKFITFLKGSGLQLYRHSSNCIDCRGARVCTPGVYTQHTVSSTKFSSAQRVSRCLPRDLAAECALAPLGLAILLCLHISCCGQADRGHQWLTLGGWLGPPRAGAPPCSNPTFLTEWPRRRAKYHHGDGVLRLPSDMIATALPQPATTPSC